MGNIRKRSHFMGLDSSSTQHCPTTIYINKQDKEKITITITARIYIVPPTVMDGGTTQTKSKSQNTI